MLQPLTTGLSGLTSELSPIISSLSGLVSEHISVLSELAPFTSITPHPVAGNNGTGGVDNTRGASTTTALGNNLTVNFVAYPMHCPMHYPMHCPMPVLSTFINMHMHINAMCTENVNSHSMSKNKCACSFS